MVIGIFGGTFNPPHRGHLSAATAAIDALGLDKLYVIPVGEPPHKRLPPDSPSAKARYRMAQLMFASEEKVSVLDIEIRRDGPSYTVDTARELAERHPGATLYLLMGTDMFLSLESWQRAGELMGLVTPCVFSRADGDAEKIRAHTAYIKDRFGADTRCIEHRIVEVSSTALRQTLSQREGVELVGETVYSEIIKKRYCGARPSFGWLREKAYSMLKPKRVAHVQGCEQEAVRLARRWGADEELAREAAILHDITKALDINAQLRLCEKYDIIADTMEKESKKLLHAKTGGAIAREEFGVTPAVYEAICCHTTGKPDMTLLDKVLYLADYIEPTRNFDEVYKMRDMAYTDLDSAVKYGLELSIIDLTQQGIDPHPRTSEAIAWYTKGD